MENLDRSQFLSRYGRVFDSIFQSREAVPAVAFKNAGWKLLLFPGSPYFDRKCLEVLASLSNGVGDRLIVTEVESVDRHELNAVINITDFESLGAASMLAHLDVAIFDVVSNWGAVSGVDEYLLIAGVKSLIEERILIPFGGEKRLRAAFIEYADKWGVTAHFKWSLLSLVGWERLE